MKEHLEALREHVEQDLQDNPDAYMTTASLTTAFLDERAASGEWRFDGEGIRAFLYAGIAAEVRKIMQRNGPQGDDEQLPMELAENVALQDWYGVTGEGGEQAYRHRDRLNRDEVMQIARGFRRRSERYARHADALEAYYHRMHPEQSEELGQ